MNAPDIHRTYLKARAELHDLIEDFGMATFHLREAISFHDATAFATDSARDAMEALEGMATALNNIVADIAKTLPPEDEE